MFSVCVDGTLTDSRRCWDLSYAVKAGSFQLLRAWLEGGTGPGMTWQAKELGHWVVG